MEEIIILGDILCTSHIQGISRYAYQVIKYLDSYVTDLNIAVVYPANASILLPNVQNIKIKKMEIKKKQHFRKDVVRKYAKNNDCLVIDLGPGFSYYKKAITTYHDIRPLDLRVYDKNKERIKLCLMLMISKIKNEQIVTVSNYQKKRIHELTHIQMNKIEVIGNGWEHICEIKPDNTIFKKYSNIKKGEYFYSIGSMALHKNYRWIYEVAKRNASFQFVIAGRINPKYWGYDEKNIMYNNIIYTGYISDEENVALMSNCKAYIHPSKYEGFGIPPLEALALGRKAIISNATCLPEIFGVAVQYLDPDNYNFDFDFLNCEECEENREKVLNKYTWEVAAKKWNKLIRAMMRV